MNLGSMIEKSLRQIEQEKEKENEFEAEAADDDEALENELFGGDGESLLTDEDFMELNDMEEEDEEVDNNYLKSLLEEGEL